MFLLCIHTAQKCNHPLVQILLFEGENHLVLGSCRITDQTLSIIEITPLKRYTFNKSIIHRCFSKLFQGIISQRYSQANKKI